MTSAMPPQATELWNDCWLDFYDMISEGVFMPLGAILMSLLIAGNIRLRPYMMSARSAAIHLRKGFFDICFKYVIPVGVAFVLYSQIRISSVDKT